MEICQSIIKYFSNKIMENSTENYGKQAAQNTFY